MSFNKQRFIKLIIAIIIAVLGVIGAGMTSDADTTVLPYYLACDSTDTHEYLPYYTCGHYTRDLVYNASQFNITLGGIILGNRPGLRGHQNHIMNYYTDNEQIWVIEPQTDRILKLEDTAYCYYRLYPDGSQVPTNWKNILSYKVIT